MNQKHKPNRNLGQPTILVAATTFLLLAVGGCAPQADVPAVEADVAVEANAAEEADAAAAKAVFDEATAALNAGDGSIVDLNTEDVVIMYANAPVAIGREASREREQMFAAQSTFEEVRSVDEVVVSDESAFVRWNGTGTITAKDGGEPIEFNRKGITILRRQADASWKITHAIWNSNLPVGE